MSKYKKVVEYRLNGKPEALIRLDGYEGYYGVHYDEAWVTLKDIPKIRKLLDEAEEKLKKLEQL